MTPRLQFPVVVASGVCTPLGFSVSAVDAAMRAGLAMFAETPWLNRRGRPVRASAVDGLGWDVPLPMRMGMLAATALERMQPHTRPTGGRVPAIFLAVPSMSLADAVLDVLDRSVAVREPVRLFGQGRSAFFFALEAALAAFAAGRVSSALVGGVDSLCTRETIDRLDSHDRLLGASRIGGVIPGEGAGFLLLESAEHAFARGQAPPGLVLATATASERHHFLQDEPNRAEGLTSVLRSLQDHPARGQRRADLFYTCETGESFWAEELAIASLRANALMPEPFTRRIAAEAFGDLGAASGAVMLAVGLHALGRHVGDRHPSLFLLSGSGDDGHVGACLACNFEYAD